MKIRREIADDDHYNKYWAVYNAKVGPFLTHNTEDYSIEPWRGLENTKDRQFKTWTKKNSVACFIPK